MNDCQVLDSYGLRTKFDSFVEDKCIWVVDLESGAKIFQDDDRPDHNISSAWIRLGNYIKDFNDKIIKMRLRFGTNIVELPGNKPYYFYSCGLMQSINSKNTHGIGFHVVGWPNDKGELLCRWYKKPELVVTEERIRSLKDCRAEQIIGVDFG